MSKTNKKEKVAPVSEEDVLHCRDCRFYRKPKCIHKEVNDFTARKNSCAYYEKSKKK